MQAEGYDLVRCIVADIGGAKIGNVASRAPALRDLFGLQPERPVIFADVADAPKPDAGKPARAETGCDVEKGAVKGIEILADLLDEQDMPRQIGLERGAEQHRQRHQVERRMARAMFEPALARARIARDEPVERAEHRHITALAPDVGDHRAVRHMVETVAIECAEQIALVRIAKERLAARNIGHCRDRFFGDAARAITTARKPDRVDVGAVGHRHQRFAPHRIGARKMPVNDKALRIEHQFDLGIAQRRNGPHRFRIVGKNGGGGGNDAYAHDLK